MKINANQHKRSQIIGSRLILTNGTFLIWKEPRRGSSDNRSETATEIGARGQPKTPSRSLKSCPLAATS